MRVIMDIISVSALFNHYNYHYRNGPKKAKKAAKEGKKVITIEKKETVER